MSFKVKFHVSKIGYNDKREIVKLEIKDQSGKVRYTLGAEQPKPKTVKATDSIDSFKKELKDATGLLNKCKDIASVDEVVKAYKTLWTNQDFKNATAKRRKELNEVK